MHNEALIMIEDMYVHKYEQRIGTIIGKTHTISDACKLHFYFSSKQRDDNFRLKKLM